MSQCGLEHGFFVRLVLICKVGVVEVLYWKRFLYTQHISIWYTALYFIYIKYGIDFGFPHMSIKWNVDFCNDYLEYIDDYGRI